MSYRAWLLLLMSEKGVITSQTHTHTHKKREIDLCTSQDKRNLRCTDGTIKQSVKAVLNITSQTHRKRD